MRMVTFTLGQVVTTPIHSIGEMGMHDILPWMYSSVKLFWRLYWCWLVVLLGW
jgi:hypothetical protein